MVSWSDLRVLQKEWGWASRRKRAINRYIDESFGDTDLIDAEISTKRRRLEDFLSGSPETRVNLDGETVVQFDDGASDGSVTLLGSESGNDEDSDFSHRSILSEAHTFLGSAPNCNSERARVNLSEDPFDQGALCDPTCDNLSKRLCGRRVNDKDARVLPNKPCGPNHGWTKQFEAECDRSCTNQIFFNLEKRRGTAGAEISSDSWTAAECDLISRLSMRGFEPLLPSGWRLDFPTFPSPLFSSGTKKPLIRSLKGRDFHGTYNIQRASFKVYKVRC